jgi:hypothetical protein
MTGGSWQLQPMQCVHGAYWPHCCLPQSEEAPERDGYLYAFGIVITGMAQSLLHQWVRAPCPCCAHRTGSHLAMLPTTAHAAPCCTLPLVSRLLYSAVSTLKINTPQSYYNAWILGLRMRISLVNILFDKSLRIDLGAEEKEPWSMVPSCSWPEEHVAVLVWWERGCACAHVYVYVYVHVHVCTDRPHHPP